MYITQIRSDVAYRNELPNLTAQASTNAAELKLTVPQLSVLDAQATAFYEAMDAVAAAKAALRAAVATKDEAFATVRTAVNNYAKGWRADQSVSDATLQSLNVPPHQTPATSTPLVTPTELTYTVNTENVVTLRWKSGGNARGTIYNIETSANGTSWSVAGTETKKKFEMSSVPGVSKWFRIVAIRGSLRSYPTQPIVVWPASSSGGVFQLEAA